MPSAGVRLIINGRPGNPERGTFIETADLPKRSIKLAFDNIGRDHQQHLVKDMRTRNRTGQIYNVKIRGRRRRHQASRPPNESLASMTGTMASGIDYAVSGATQLEFGSTGKAFWATIWETADASIRRTTLGNTVRALQRNTFNYFADEIQKELFKIYNPGGKR